MERNSQINLTDLHFLLVTLLVLGVFFRFAQLDQKVYWYDEVFTSLRVSGYMEAEIVQQLSESRVIGLEDLQKYQRPNPDKSFIDPRKRVSIFCGQ